MESNISRDMSPNTSSKMEDDSIDDELEEQGDLDDLGTHTEGIAGPSSKVVKPLTTEELSAFKVAQEKTGVIYISRIPPGMRPTKVKHLMSAYGEVGRVYLQPEGMPSIVVAGNDRLILSSTDPKRSFLRRKYTSTKKVHYTEGWIEFKDKRVARSVADMLNAQPIGGKKGTRWRDDVWTMKYLPKFKWNMLTEQIGEYLVSPIGCGIHS